MKERLSKNFVMVELAWLLRCYLQGSSIKDHLTLYPEINTGLLTQFKAQRMRTYRYALFGEHICVMHIVLRGYNLMLVDISWRPNWMMLVNPQLDGLKKKLYRDFIWTVSFYNQCHWYLHICKTKLLLAQQRKQLHKRPTFNFNEENKEQKNFMESKG